MTKQELLHREEAREPFVLGVIATIHAFKDELVSLIAPSGALVREVIVLLLVANWASYAFLMATRLSDDVFKPSV